MAKEIDYRLMLLFDLYKPLLSEKKRQAFEYYYCEDLSLSEIAQLQGVSRQAVLEGIRLAEKKLCDSEKKLGFQKRLAGISAQIEKISDICDKPYGEIEAENEKTSLNDIKKICSDALSEI